MNDKKTGYKQINFPHNNKHKQQTTHRNSFDDNVPSTSTSSTTTKFSNEQNMKIESNYKKGNHNVNREIVIPRRFDDVKKSARETRSPQSHDRSRSTSINKSNGRRVTQKSSSSSESSSEENTTEEVPYYADKQREKDRLREKAKLLKNSKNNYRRPIGSPDRRYESRSHDNYRRRSRDRRSRSNDRHSRRSRSRSRERNRYYNDRPIVEFIPVPVPMDYPYDPHWMPPVMPYHYGTRYPFYGGMIRPPFQVPHRFPPSGYQRFSRPPRGRNFR